MTWLKHIGKYLMIKTHVGKYLMGIKDLNVANPISIQKIQMKKYSLV